MKFAWRQKNSISFISCSAIVALFIFCFFHRASGPLVADDVDFVIPIKTWFLHGPRRWGIWHSAFYPWILYMLGRAYGALTPTLERSVGLVSALVTARYLWLTARFVAPHAESWRMVSLLTLALLSPVCLGSSLILDYDNTVLAASTAIYFYALFRLQNPDGLFYKVLIFGGLIGVCLLSRETTPLLYPIGMWVLWSPRIGWKKALAAAAMGEVIAVTLFLMVSWAWCIVYDLPLSVVFAGDLAHMKIREGYTLHEKIAHAVWVMSEPVLWIGLPLALAFCRRVPQLLRNSNACRAITVTILTVVCVYTFIFAQGTYQFPKYMAPLLPWIGWLVLFGIPETEKQNAFSWEITLLCGLGLALFIDPLQVLHDRSFFSLLVCQLPILVLMAVFWRKKIPHAAISLSVALSIVYVGFALLSQKSITYWYGDTALVQINAEINRWRETHPKGQVYVTAKDLAYAAEAPSVTSLEKDALSEQARTICNQQFPVLLVSRKREDSSLLRDPIRHALAAHCKLAITVQGDLVLGEVLKAFHPPEVASR